MLIHLISENAKVPFRASEGAAGYDLYSTESRTIKPQTREHFMALQAKGIKNKEKIKIPIKEKSLRFLLLNLLLTKLSFSLFILV